MQLQTFDVKDKPKQSECNHRVSLSNTENQKHSRRVMSKHRSGEAGMALLSLNWTKKKEAVCVYPGGKHDSGWMAAYYIENQMM